MELIVETVKEYLQKELNDVIKEISTKDVPLKPVLAKDYVVGYLDFDKFTVSPTIFLVPSEQEHGQLTNSSVDVNGKVKIYVIVRGADPDVLYKQSVRYCAAVKKCIYNDPSLGSDEIGISYVETTDYFPGVTGYENCKGTYIEIVVQYEEEI